MNDGQSSVSVNNLLTCLDKSSYMMRACFPLSLKYSPMAQPAYGARYCRGAASEAVALTIVVYFMASERIRQINHSN